LDTWKYFRQRQVGKYILAYLVFIILNYVICLAPIGASYYFSPQTLLLSSFLAYCFTLLAVTVYSFMYFPKENVGGTIKANLGIIMAILFMLGYIVMFILYNLVENVSHTLNTSIVRTALLAFIPVFVVSLVLSIPVIKLQVAADKSQQLIKKIRRSEKEGDEVISEIDREGIS
jgi:hypothetical protein